MLVATMALPAISHAEEADIFVCPPAPAPVLSLDYDSRYEENSETRSDLDDDANAKVNAAQKPLDDFIRDITELANRVYLAPNPAQIADCVVSQIAQWAGADALGDLKTETTQLTFGSRLAGLAMALWQVRSFGGKQTDWAEVRPWLANLATSQMVFWEVHAPPGARQGNLRAWAALGIAATADIVDDPVMRGWATWSTAYILCTANPDGSLPREMMRGRLALHYQLHAVAPLVATSRLLLDHGIKLDKRCDQALSRIVDFTLSDLQNGEATREITGEIQSYFDGSREIRGFNLAWLEAWISLAPSAQPLALAEKYRPLISSKLGGNQTLIWQ